MSDRAANEITARRRGLTRLLRTVVAIGFTAGAASSSFAQRIYVPTQSTGSGSSVLDNLYRENPILAPPPSAAPKPFVPGNIPEWAGNLKGAGDLGLEATKGVNELNNKILNGMTKYGAPANVDPYQVIEDIGKNEQFATTLKTVDKGAKILGGAMAVYDVTATGVDCYQNGMDKCAARAMGTAVDTAMYGVGLTGAGTVPATIYGALRLTDSVVSSSLGRKSLFESCMEYCAEKTVDYFAKERSEMREQADQQYQASSSHLVALQEAENERQAEIAREQAEAQQQAAEAQAEQQQQANSAFDFANLLGAVTGAALQTSNPNMTPIPSTGGGEQSAAACSSAKVFNTPDGCHPGHDEKGHPGGCHCG